MERKAHAQKLMVLGVDGLDPKFTKRMLREGKMPNLAKFVEKGACRDDLVLLGGHPTITPPMWTTLATGCYANVHGITGFYRQHPFDLEAVTYALDSRDCHAEQVWNCTAEAGLKTLVFHWPGSSWPPTSDSENLFVIDGTSPGALGMATSQTEKEFTITGTDKVENPKFLSNADPNVVAICVVEELPDRSESDGRDWNVGDAAGRLDRMAICDDCGPHPTPRIDAVQSPIKPATGWANAPTDAKESVLLLSRGLIRRPVLLLKNAQGVYDSLAVYKSKKDAEPIVVLEMKKVQMNIIDDGFDKNDEKVTVTRNMRLYDMAEDGSYFRCWVSAAMNVNVYETWHPQRMYDYIKEVCGPTPPTSNMYEQDPEIHECMMDSWEFNCQWQSKAIHEIIKREGIQVVFSHMHNVDLLDHTFITFCSKTLHTMMDKNPTGQKAGISHEEYVQWLVGVYEQTDRYLGTYLHFLDEGWSFIITSDHAQVASSYAKYPHLGSVTGYSVKAMEEFGYTVLKKDADGNVTRDIDWTKTTAIANRSEDIYINLKGRNKHIVDGVEIDGLVDPADQYELEEKIMTDLYSLKSPITGKRVVSLAVRNKDAVHFGLGGPECGDIIYFLAEGYNQHHGDSLSTFEGEEETSVSPIFIAGGPGFKTGYRTDRIIRQIDVAPTISAIMGVRMPAQCEGSPVYPILDWEF